MSSSIGIIRDHGKSTASHKRKGGNCGKKGGKLLKIREKNKNQR